MFALLTKNSICWRRKHGALIDLRARPPQVKIANIESWFFSTQLIVYRQKESLTRLATLVSTQHYFCHCWRLEFSNEITFQLLHPLTAFVCSMVQTVLQLASARPDAAQHNRQLLGGIGHLPGEIRVVGMGLLSSLRTSCQTHGVCTALTGDVLVRSQYVNRSEADRRRRRSPLTPFTACLS